MPLKVHTPTNHSSILDPEKRTKRTTTFPSMWPRRSDANRGREGDAGALVQLLKCFCSCRFAVYIRQQYGRALEERVPLRVQSSQAQELSSIQSYYDFVIESVVRAYSAHSALCNSLSLARMRGSNRSSVRGTYAQTLPSPKPPIVCVTLRYHLYEGLSVQRSEDRALLTVSLTFTTLSNSCPKLAE